LLDPRICIKNYGSGYERPKHLPYGPYGSRPGTMYTIPKSIVPVVIMKEPEEFLTDGMDGVVIKPGGVGGDNDVVGLLCYIVLCLLHFLLLLTDTIIKNQAE
jgi:hypothetical protein